VGEVAPLRFFFSSRRRHTRLQGDWSSDVCSSDRKAADVKPKHMNTGHPHIDALVAVHAAANDVPEALIHRVIVRESKYQKDLVRSEERRVGKEWRWRW